jgi:rare lipoprotein A (peptidoglycan hydrolase)
MTDLVTILLALLAAIAQPTLPDTATDLRGYATWYDAPSSHDAAAGPALRRMLGRDWRGSWVRVSHVGDGEVRTVNVRLSDWCLCRDRHGEPTLIDLDDRAFDELGSLGAGVIRVSIEEIQGVPTVLPPTDTAGGETP